MNIIPKDIKRINMSELTEILQGHSLEDMIIYPDPTPNSKLYMVSITWTDRQEERGKYLLDPGNFQLKFEN